MKKTGKTMEPDFQEILSLADAYQPVMSSFLRDMVAIPSQSRNEKVILSRIREEMEIVGFDRVEIDPMGNLLGCLGTGQHLIAMDAHVDTVGPGNIDNWKHDPYKGAEDQSTVHGLGVSDQAGGMAAMVYAAKIIKELDLRAGLSNTCSRLYRSVRQEAARRQLYFFHQWGRHNGAAQHPLCRIRAGADRSGALCE